MKLIAVMDAYHAPYTPKHRYWTGLLLMLRVALYLIQAINIHDEVRINLLAIVIAMMNILVLNKSVYKSWILYSLETCFTLNLGILAGATIYVRDTVRSQTGLAYTSTGVSLFLFIAILIYHTSVFVLKYFPIWRKLTNMYIKNWKQPVNYLHEDSDKDEQSGDSYYQREPLNLISNQPNTGDYRKAKPHNQRGPNHGVTHTVIDGRPNNLLIL